MHMLVYCVPALSTCCLGLMGGQHAHADQITYRIRSLRSLVQLTCRLSSCALFLPLIMVVICMMMLTCHPVRWKLRSTVRSRVDRLAKTTAGAQVSLGEW